MNSVSSIGDDTTNYINDNRICFIKGFRLTMGFFHDAISEVFSF